MAYSINHFNHNEQLVEQLGSSIATALDQAITQRGFATIAVSGGNTPRPLFEFLSHQDLPWNKVCVTLVDERWVEEHHPESNARLVKELLLQDRAAPAQFEGFYTPQLTALEAEKQVDDRLQQLTLPLDVVILGLGEDGHTASLFPGADNLAKAVYPDTLQRCCAIESPNSPHQRMTLTLPTLLNSRRLFLHFNGDKKLKVLKKAFQTMDFNHESRPTFAAINDYPIRSFLFQDRPELEIYYSN